jgi:hypothetical protein
MCGSTCFGRLPAHHQEHTTALGTSGFTIGKKRLEHCWSWSARPSNKLVKLLHLVGWIIWIVCWCTDLWTSKLCYCSSWHLTLLTCSEIPNMHFQFWCLDHSTLLNLIISYKKGCPSWDDNYISGIRHRPCFTMTPFIGLPLIWCMLSLVSGVQGDQKVCVHLMITIQKVTSNV